MSIKSERNAEIVHRELSIILANEVKDSYIKYVTITHIDLASDLSFAKIYFNILDQDKKDATIKALDRANGFIRRELGQRVDFRKVPELRFIYDESLEYGMKIEKIIDELK